jgi:phosphatidylglycerol lysyltransferase
MTASTTAARPVTVPAAGAGGVLLLLLVWWAAVVGPWTARAGGALVPGAGVLVVAGIVVLTLGRWSARVLGTAGTVLAAAAGYAAGVVAGLSASGSGGAALPTGEAVLIGLALAASSQLTPLWRRRARLLVVSLLLTTALYAGQPADVARLAAALAGLGVGALLAHRTAPARLPTRQHSAGRLLTRHLPTRQEGRVLVALLLAVTAVGPIVASLSADAVGPLAVLQQLFTAPPVDGEAAASACADPTALETCARLRQALLFSGVGPSLLAVLPCAVVLVLAEGLRRGRRSAWVAALGLHALLGVLGVVLAVSIVRTPSEEAARLALEDAHGTLSVWLPLLQPLVVLALLAVARPVFTVRAPRGTHRHLTTFAAATVAATGTAFVVVGHLVRDQFTPTPTWWVLVRAFPGRLVPPGYLGEITPVLLPHGGAAGWLFDWTGVAVWSAVLVVAARTFATTRLPGAGGQAARARAVVQTHGSSGFAWMTTWTGHSYWFAPDGGSFVAYRVHGGVALSTGDPVGPVAGLTATLDGFLAYCADRGWTPCLYGTGAGVRALTAGRGWGSVQVAEEAVLPLGALAFTGKRFQDIRTATNRAAREGLTATWISYADAPPELAVQIRALSATWLADKALPEMGFTLGGIEELADPDVRCLVALDGAGALQGVVSWLPAHRDGRVVGWTLDLMRRAPAAPNGVVEMLIAHAVLQFQAEGASFASLSGAPLAHAASGGDAELLPWALDAVGRLMEPVYGFRSLLAFKAKFAPRLDPLFLCYPEAVVLPRIAAAISHAYLPALTPLQGARLLMRGRRRAGHRAKIANRPPAPAPSGSSRPR